MFKHNIFDILKTFSLNEIKKFEQYLKSPYINGSEKILNLFREIARFYPEFNNKDLTKKNLSIRSSVSGRYNESTLRDALSELLKLTLKYLTVMNFDRNIFDTENYLLDELLQRNLYKIFQKRIKGGDNIPSKIDAKFLYNKYWNDTLLFNFDITNKAIMHKKDAYERIDILKLASVDLFKFYVTEIVSLHLNSMIIANKYNISHTKNPLSLIIEKLDLDYIVKIYSSSDLVIVYVYKHLLEAFDNFDDENYYYTYKKYIEKYKQHLSHNELVFHYNWMINYCIFKKKACSKEDNFIVELFSIYNFILINKLYKDKNNKYLSVDLYRDIMIHGLYLKQDKWTMEFIEKYYKEVNPSHRENILNYSYTYYYCYSGSYSLALEFYNKIVMNNFVFKYDIKNLVTRMYYELNYFEEALCEIKSFKEFLRNNSLVPQHRKIRTGNYLKYFEKLILYQLDNNINDLGYLKKRIVGDKNVTFKEWLLNKIDLLILNFKSESK